jgi:hypothetical protein
MCLLKYALNYEQHFSYFSPDYPTSRLARAYCTSLLEKLSLLWIDSDFQTPLIKMRCVKFPVLVVVAVKVILSAEV